MSNNNNSTDKYLSKKQLLTIMIIMWVGVVLCVLAWTPEFTVFGLSSQVIGLPGGLMALVGVVLLMFLPKCPHCGSHKIGMAVGTRLRKEVECPNCKKKVEIK